MTESDWLSADNPTPMFRYVRTRLSARKLRLLACGCCRLLGLHLAAAEQDALGVVERHADGLATDGEYQKVNVQLLTGIRDLVPAPGGEVVAPTPRAAALHALLGVISLPNDDGLRRVLDWVGAAAARDAGSGLRTAARREVNRLMCGVFHEVVGNPFLPRASVGPGWTGGRAPHWLLRVGETARAIAVGVQADQAFDRLPILADALEDDGCTDDDLLFHFRHHPTHLRGCWALDLVLGKS
jgi:hypothetical protein